MFAAVLSFGMMALQQQPAHGAVLKPEGEPLTLTGRIRLIHGYGPPGYGEDPKHDRPTSYWVIDLPIAITTACKPERPEWAAIDCRSAKRLRLMIETNGELNTGAEAMQGRRVVVNGVLHRQDTMGEMTPIYVDVTDIKPLP